MPSSFICHAALVSVYLPTRNRETLTKPIRRSSSLLSTMDRLTKPSITSKHLPDAILAWKSYTMPRPWAHHVRAIWRSRRREENWSSIGKSLSGQESGSPVCLHRTLLKTELEKSGVPSRALLSGAICSSSKAAALRSSLMRPCTS